ncbi:MAG: PSD1 domain-containing protein [Planctomycetes bacterium]|nr:PSD1 domain-containing protein [Planctomycetota bacterium]
MQIGLAGAALLLVGGVWALARAEEKPAAAEQKALSAGEQLFVEKVGPILRNKCAQCHGAADLEEAELDVTGRDGLLKGGESGPVTVVPREPEKSLLFRAVRRDDPDLAMPPDESEALSKDEVEAVRAWIAEGAPWVDLPKAALPAVAAPSAWNPTAAADGFAVATSGGLSPEWTHRKYTAADVWAYLPVRRYPVPKRTDSSGKQLHAIDAFLQEKLAEKDLKPAPPAEPREWLRRATFDLTGLPPTPEEMEAFAGQKSNTESPDYTAAIDRLLASPHYGEQMARHWLDVTRYADTSGFSNDYERPHAWRYRDYVVRSFNADKPYDRFVVEQIAGDELDAGDPELQVAVGFLRMGPWEHTGMSVAAETRQAFLDDVTNSVGVTFLGQGLRCARCHDHKFDPIPTRDYYRIQAVFAPTQFLDKPVPFLPGENTASLSVTKPLTESRLAHAQAKLAEFKAKNEAAIAAWVKENGYTSLQEVPLNKRPPQRFFGLSPLEMSLLKVNQKREAYFKLEMRRYEPEALTVYNGPNVLFDMQTGRPMGTMGMKKVGASSSRVAGAKQRGAPVAKVEGVAGSGGAAEDPVRKTPSTGPSPSAPDPATRKVSAPAGQKPSLVQPVFILAGGSLASAGERVTPGVLSACFGSSDAHEATAWNTIPQGMNGRRLALARWIASEQNPLTARVIVNRVWQMHFGRGLVATPNNFGKMGAKPTHPELLDWLAVWFMEHDWSVKRLHRLIMSSAAYRQASSHPDFARVNEVDAKNEMLSYFPARRLAAEELRDAMLRVTGELNATVGGPPVFPEINWETALQPRHIMGSVAPAYQPSTRPADRHRRTLYAFQCRTLGDPMLEVFNRPTSDLSCERRDATTVTPQVFALFNGQATHDRALALAARLAKAHGDLEARLDAVYALLYGRTPTDDERRLAREHVARMTEHHRRETPTPTSLPQVVKREMIEELTGELFQWEERLDGLAAFEPDLKPWQVDAETRALAELCLVLLNANEFVYVR